MPPVTRDIIALTFDFLEYIESQDCQHKSWRGDDENVNPCCEQCGMTQQEVDKQRIARTTKIIEILTKQ